jgi:CRP-like cAMP-binding protein
METHLTGRDGDGPTPPQNDDYVRVFEHDPGLLDGTDRVTAGFLREHGTVTAVRLAAEPWHPPMHRASTRNWLGLLVLDGLLLRPITVGRRLVHELLGPGDLLRPWDHEQWEGVVRSHTPWPVLTPVTLAVLDQQFTAVAARTPSVVGALVSRSLRRSAQIAAAVAILDAPEPHLRVWGVLAHVADRWGEAEEGGVVLPAGLTDAAIASVLDSGEDEVTAALERLAREGAVRRTDHGALLFSG